MHGGIMALQTVRGSRCLGRVPPLPNPIFSLPQTCPIGGIVVSQEKDLEQVLRACLLIEKNSHFLSLTP
jgi:hypothetical protein